MYEQFFVFARGNFLHFFNLTNMISTHAKDFCKKLTLVINSPGFYYRFQGAKIKKCFKKFLHSYLVYIQIKLNLYVGDHKVAYITKWEKKTLYLRENNLIVLCLKLCVKIVPLPTQGFFYTQVVCCNIEYII